MSDLPTSTIINILRAVTPQRQQRGYGRPIVTIPNTAGKFPWLLQLAEHWDVVSRAINWGVLVDEELFDVISGDEIDFGDFKVRCKWIDGAPLRLSVSEGMVFIHCNLDVRGTGWISRWFSYNVHTLICNNESAVVHASGIGKRWVIPKLVWGE